MPAAESGAFYLDGNRVQDEHGVLLYVDRMCPIRAGRPWASSKNFAETDPISVIRRGLEEAVSRPGWWCVVAWGRLSGHYYEPVGLVRVPAGGERVEFTFFSFGNSDFEVTRKYTEHFPEMVARGLNEDEGDRALWSRNLLWFPTRAEAWDDVAARMAKRIFGTQ